MPQVRILSPGPLRNSPLPLRFALRRKLRRTGNFFFRGEPASLGFAARRWGASAELPFGFSVRGSADIYSVSLLHVVVNCISFATTFFKKSPLTHFVAPPLKCDPAALDRGRRRSEYIDERSLFQPHDTLLPGCFRLGEFFLPLNFPRMSVNLYSENGIYAIIIGRYLSVVAVPDFQKYI